ncbi:MAG: hypothetical protein K8I27_07010 [Planctomycetes bacterium]|nr:hypothetical protein [Planctomycetota bacterium]
MRKFRLARSGTRANDRWLRGVVPLMDLFILLFAAMLVLITDQHEREAQEQASEHQQDLSAMVQDTLLVSILVDERGVPTSDGGPLEAAQLPALFAEAAQTGCRIVVVRDPHKKLTHRMMRTIEASAESAGIKSVYTVLAE